MIHNIRSPYDFIARPVGGKRYNNTKEMSGVDVIVSTSEEDHRFANREAKVFKTPIGYRGPISEGDILLCHHNTFKIYNDVKGRRKSGRSFFQDDLFFIENDQFFMYKKDGVWNAHSKYCFVRPVPLEESYIHKNSKYEPLIGEMVYPNEYLKSKGVKSGDRVVFKPDSEYEFTVDGEVLYRMFDHQITVVL